MPDDEQTGSGRIKVVCDGCDRDYRFTKERAAIQFVAGHSRYLGHDAKRAVETGDGLRGDGSGHEGFADWLELKEAEAREKYRSGQRTEENARVKDINLGRLRAYRDARRVFLEREEHFGDGPDDESCSVGPGNARSGGDESDV